MSDLMWRLLNEGTRTDWETPGWLFDWLDKRWGPFDLDAAANERNHQCDLWLGSGSPFRIKDALALPAGSSWAGYGGRVFCNPPYGGGLKRWVGGAALAGRHGARVVLLVPNATDAGWWHIAWRNASLVVFFEGRVQFELGGSRKAGGSNTRGSCVFVFDGLRPEGVSPMVECVEVLALEGWSAREGAER